MSKSGSYELPESHTAAQAEIERLAAQASSGWEKEASTLTGFGLQDGMSVLEAGSGPGFTSAQLMSLLPNSALTCLEVDRVLLDQARHYLQQKGCQQVRLVEGSVLESGLESDQFDFAYARFLFQHLSNPQAAANEIWRLLKPGGKLVICDIDDELFGLFQPPIPEFAPVREAFGQAQAARGGDRFIGRKLAGILSTAGFADVQIEVIGSHSAERGLESYLQHLYPERMRPLVEDGFLSMEDLERYRTALCAWAAVPDAYTLWLSLSICATKPPV